MTPIHRMNFSFLLDLTTVGLDLLKRVVPVIRLGAGEFSEAKRSMNNPRPLNKLSVSNSE